MKNINIMAENRDYFNTIEGREEFCKKYHFTPCLENGFNPNLRDHRVLPNTQYFVTGRAINFQYKGAVKYHYDTIASAFLYETDLNNIKDLNHILMITYGGGRKVQVIVPIPITIQKAIKVHELYLHLWKETASKVFKDTSGLDEKLAMKGIRARMPGTKKDGKIQECIFLNKNVWFFFEIKYSISKYLNNYKCKHKSKNWKKGVCETLV